MAILRTKLLPQLLVHWSAFLNKVIWSKNSILVVTVALGSGPFRFAWGDFSFKSFAEWQTCWGLNFAYYRFPFSNVHNLLCWSMCTYSFVSREVSQICFYSEHSERIKENQYRYSWLMLIWRLNSPLQRFVKMELCSIVYITTRKFRFPRVKRQSPGNGVVYSAIKTTGLDHSNFVVIWRTLI